MDYWRNKEAMAERAIEWTKKMQLFMSNETADSVKRSTIYPALPDEEKWYAGNNSVDTNIVLVNHDTVKAICQYGQEPDSGKLAALNFASYKNPGGMFVKGSMAQEECLCHNSNLYCVLNEFMDSFYRPNRKKLNYALYNSDVLYNPDIRFISDDGSVVKCDIITCAAPNRRAAERYHKVERIIIREHLIDRIEHVLRAAVENNVDTLILGAFGCGVFGNSPEMVAGIFKEELCTNFKGCFKKVIFAIPDASSYNYIAFEKCLSDIIN